MTSLSLIPLDRPLLPAWRNSFFKEISSKAVNAYLIFWLSQT
jgi:hypothetical protein